MSRSNPAVAGLAVVVAIDLFGCVPPNETRQYTISDIAPDFIEAPTANTSPALRAFSGVWLGKWDGTWDAAILVQQIAMSGDVQATYRWVEHVGQTYSVGQEHSGSVHDGLLVLGNIELRIEPSDPNQAIGIIHTRNGVDRRSTFRKQAGPASH